MRSSPLELALEYQIKNSNLPAPVREFPAIEGRRFRFDFAWPDQKLLVEVQGATFQRGAHSTGIGLHRDYEKLNLATIAGYRCFMFDAVMVGGGDALHYLQTFFDTAKS